jgi:hypothetical protein
MPGWVSHQVRFVSEPMCQNRFADYNFLSLDGQFNLHINQNYANHLVCVTSGEVGTGFKPSGVPRNFVRGGVGASANSVEYRGQRERGSGGVSSVVRGSAQFANE